MSNRRVSACSIRIIRYRSPQPILTPMPREERHGIVPNVVFPTGIDRRDDLAKPDCIDIYYGMADSRIGVARLALPGELPFGQLSQPPTGLQGDLESRRVVRGLCDRR